jgi:chromosome segregation ATPase
LATVNASGEISEGKSLSYDQIVKSFGSLESKLDGIMSIMKELNVKLEQQEVARKRAALISQRVALRKAAARKAEEAYIPKVEEVKSKSEEEEAKRKKLEELKSRLSEVKSKLSEESKRREASAAVPATGKGNVGAVKEESNGLIPGSETMPDYFKEILGADANFKRLGLLSG